MSKYTTELRFICEESAGLAHSEGYSSIDSVLDKARDKVFDFDFPIFDENYRIPLENKILKHYYTREIGFETVGLWKHFLNMRMNEIMPYYNKLYSSELIEFNPMYDVDLTTDYNKVNNGDRDKSSEFIEQGSFIQEDTASQHNNASVLTGSAGSETTQHVKTFNEDNVANEAGEFSNTTNNTEHTHAEENANGNETKGTTSNGTSTTSGTDNNTITNINDHWEYFSDTPEGGIQGLTASGAVGDLNYLTTATHITDNGTGSTNNKTYGSTTGTSETETSNTDTNTNKVGDSNTTGEIEKAGTDSKNSNSNKEGKEENNTTTTTTGSGTSESEGDVNSNAVKTGNNDKAGSANSNEVIKNIEDYLHHVVGKSAGVSYSKLLNEYRDTFLNIDMMIIKDLKDLFMNVW